MLKKGRTTEVEEINEELNRLWKSGAIEIDGKSYNKEKETGYEKKKDEVKEADKSEPETETSEVSSEDNTEPEAPEENEDAQTEQEAETDETENTDSEGSDDNDPEGSDKESSEEDSKEGESESSEDGVKEYVKSKPAGFFSEDTLDTYNLDQLKSIGSEMGLDVRSRKKGIRMITKLVEKVLSE